jgi:hypothetical protein
MKRIFTSLALATLVLLTTTASSQLTGMVPNSACSVIGEDFIEDPFTRGFLIENFSWSGKHTSAQSLRTWYAGPNTVYKITTPATPLASNGSLRMGFKVSTKPGSNNYFATGAFNVNVKVLDVDNKVLASTTGYFNAAGSYCFQLVDGALTQGKQVKFYYELITTHIIDSTRIVDFDLLTYNGNENIILPVTFNNISGRSTSSGNMITWKVSEEINVKNYEVEKSTNGSTYTKIGEVNASGSSSYSFTDQNISSSDYYRVRSKDHDGYEKLSPVVSLKSGKEGRISLRAFPSPARTEIFIQHDGSQLGIMNINSIDGRTIKTISTTKNTVQTRIDISTMQPGLYILSYRGQDGEFETLKFTKQ